MNCVDYFTLYFFFLYSILFALLTSFDFNFQYTDPMAVRAVCYLSALKAHVRIEIVSLFSFTGLSEHMMHKLTWVFLYNTILFRALKSRELMEMSSPFFFCINIMIILCLFAFVQQHENWKYKSVQTQVSESAIFQQFNIIQRILHWPH